MGEGRSPTKGKRVDPRQTDHFCLFSTLEDTPTSANHARQAVATEEFSIVKYNREKGAGIESYRRCLIPRQTSNVRLPSSSLLNTPFSICTCRNQSSAPCNSKFCPKLLHLQSADANTPLGQKQCRSYVSGRVVYSTGL